ncbi:transposase [Sinobaca qinghaiensis]|uniref:Transposase n=3 Tax=Sinobaca qinghaiensis TaxID=342944 RepID=A0A419VU17_9BACL|nr:transposase [Sinobaca qinghaiensis]RKD83792.1 transposase [Sinobaca qinghaiensis]
MAKYSDAFKEQLVQEYLRGPKGYKRLAKKYGLPSMSPIKEWVDAYRLLGREGLKRKTKKSTYTGSFKWDVLYWRKQRGASLQETAEAFGLPRASLIAAWNRTWEQEGMAGLEEKPKGRPPMTDKSSRKPLSSPPVSREAQLERENELLRLENAYLKKLRAFRKKPAPSPEKHKQGLRSSSRKKDSD